jgi:hypothetical protein
MVLSTSCQPIGEHFGLARTDSQWHYLRVPISTPRWPLETVKALVAAGAFDLTRSARTAAFDTDEEAIEAFIEIIASLGAAAFAHQQSQNDEIFDVYGVRWEGLSFYLKFTVRGDEVVICISLHKPAFPLQTRGGIIK